MILDGKIVATKCQEKNRAVISSLPSKPGFGIILVGANPASHIYVEKKTVQCRNAGIKVEKMVFPSDCKEQDILNVIQMWNKTPQIHGILIQLPLPPHLHQNTILDSVDPEKDIDGLSTYAQGRIFKNLPSFIPCTPLAVLRILQHYNINVEGKRAVIVNRSVLLGRPLAALLLNMDATVTICHSKTLHLKDHTRSADIIITGIGKKHFITADMVKFDSIVIDCGIIKEDGKIYGDVDTAKVKRIAAVTPVPGGVGPVTVAMVIENTLTSYLQWEKKNSDSN
jgi:methylenetetrahydrofolate dehydrogenase (NADP+) / methenyltetrahydrofolate cyclohydrolase